MYLGAFGKHPGWDDHLDDQGLETQRLIDLKSLLYVEGIGSRIDSGVWDRLENTQKVEEFSHVFLLRALRGGADWTLGRIWSSRDGKGRTRYPMVIACQVNGAPLEWAAHGVFPALTSLQTTCESTTSSSAVIAALDAARSALRQSFERLATGLPEDSVPPNVANSLAAHPEMGPDRRGMHRLLYQIDRELGDYAAVPTRREEPEGVPPRPQQLRVPPCASTPEAALVQWMRFSLLKLDLRVPILMFAPKTADSGQGWVDILVGEPSGSQLFCLKASPRSIPLTTEIPYTLDPAFVSAAEIWLNACRGAPTVDVRTEPRTSRSGDGGRFS